MKKFFAYLTAIVLAIFTAVFIFCGIIATGHGVVEIFNKILAVCPGIENDIIYLIFGILLLILAMIILRLTGAMFDTIDSKNKKKSW